MFCMMAVHSVPIHFLIVGSWAAVYHLLREELAANVGGLHYESLVQLQGIYRRTIRMEEVHCYWTVPSHLAIWGNSILQQTFHGGYIYPKRCSWRKMMRQARICGWYSSWRYIEHQHSIGGGTCIKVNLKRKTQYCTFLLKMFITIVQHSWEIMVGFWN
jgi:hypothetical protein